MYPLQANQCHVVLRIPNLGVFFYCTSVQFFPTWPQTVPLPQNIALHKLLFPFTGCCYSTKVMFYQSHVLPKSCSIKVMFYHTPVLPKSCSNKVMFYQSPFYKVRIFRNECFQSPVCLKRVILPNSVLPMSAPPGTS
jgi:hypothetical protein